MKLPQYAQNYPLTELVSIRCKGRCKKRRVALLSKTTWEKQGVNNNIELFAKCLVCGFQARDKYNWIKI